MKVIADNLNAMNPLVAEALKTLDPRPIQELALRCSQAKADFIDINPGYLSKNQEDRIIFLVEAVRAVSPLGLVLDSPNARVLAKGLEACQGRAILNALTLEEKKQKEILPLAVQYQTPLILMLLDERSRPPATLEEKIALAIELRERAISAGLAEELVLFDPLLPPLSWPEAPEQIKAAILIVRHLSSGALFNREVQTLVGLSNLGSGKRNEDSLAKKRMTLSLLAGAGLSHVLADVLQPGWRNLVDQIHQMI